jgi:Protein of unknown function (DUF1566)
LSARMRLRLGIICMNHVFLTRRVGRALSGLAASLLLGALPLGAHAAGPTGALNDTGRTDCFNGTAMVVCDAASTGDASAYPRQDGRYGRDPAKPAKVGGGVAGFDFSKVCFNGDVQGSGTCTGTLVPNSTQSATVSPTTDWACTKDNVTNLIWSLRTNAITWTYAQANFPAAHNAAGRCGFSTGWRLPALSELRSLMVYDGRSPAIDLDYFPGTLFDRSYYWANEEYAGVGGYAWAIMFAGSPTFSPGRSDPIIKGFLYHIRLVRSGL